MAVVDYDAKSRIEGLIAKHKLGYVVNPGGAAFTRQCQDGEEYGPRTAFSIQVAAMGDYGEDFADLMAGLYRLGLE